MKVIRVKRDEVKDAEDLIKMVGEICANSSYTYLISPYRDLHEKLPFLLIKPVQNTNTWSNYLEPANWKSWELKEMHSLCHGWRMAT